MRYNYVLILFLFILTSCATIMTRRNYSVYIYSNESNSRVRILDSTYKLPASIKIARSKKDLHIQLLSDSLVKDYIVKKSPNSAFLYGNLLWMEVAPAAYLIDLTNQKRFYYGNLIYLDTNDKKRVIRPPVSNFYYEFFAKEFPANKGQINLVFSLPYINNFYLQPISVH